MKALGFDTIRIKKYLSFSIRRMLVTVAAEMHGTPANALSGVGSFASGSWGYYTISQWAGKANADDKAIFIKILSLLNMVF